MADDGRHSDLAEKLTALASSAHNPTDRLDGLLLHIDATVPRRRPLRETLSSFGGTGPLRLQASKNTPAWPQK
jgi:hypothetical protein